MSSSTAPLAPELAVSEWFNTPAPLTLAALRGRPVFLHTFQVLCPGCVAEAIPQVQRIERIFANTDLQVIGIHTVFEHHSAMSPVTLRAFLHEYRLRSPVGVDLAEEGSEVPVTMQRFGLRGTPSSVLIGRDGSILHHAFGVEDDIAVGARIAMALSTRVPEIAPTAMPDQKGACVDGKCAVPSPSKDAA
ncbi:TlpA family protein disulfide reductase [Rhizobiaceae bacterium n13]|uniref:TlpA family protein disulfide reductase n=1 Tax=Ferirhizobium litorale TaxID=2927786 RepID=A0AAE3QBW2_9HYPH|nr:TlpA disulfide reductase family protein [Fererhizobium litorale]MDI7863513.1 TlpA family protein disulfide reductase [Fererhizobium litorale]MDI7922210.1 TlpA family protein disulfide reductase [Fererhizobium litorale]